MNFETVSASGVPRFLEDELRELRAPDSVMIPLSFCQTSQSWPACIDLGHSWGLASREMVMRTFAPQLETDHPGYCQS